MNVEEIIKTDKKISAETRTIIHLTMVHNYINEALTTSLKPYEVSIQQFNVLRILRGQGNTPANLSTINDRMVTKMSNTTRLVDKLLSKGYVDRITCKSNRRKIEINITEAGKKALKNMDKSIKATEKSILKQFTTSELTTLNVLLNKFK